jgi:choline dehydrogenase-like flavoprotein
VIGRADVRRIPFATDRIVDGISQFSPPVQFGRTYRATLEQSEVVTVYLYANVVEIETDGGGRAVRGVKVATLTGGTASVSAKIFVLATGGIENARLLLVSNKTWPAGLGNEYDLVGRFFMDHPRVYSGWVRFRDGWARNRLYDHKYHYQSDAVAAHGTRVAAQMMLSPATQAREQLLNAQVWFASIFVGEDSEAKFALMRLKRMFERREMPEQSLSRDLMTLLCHPLDSAGFALARLMQLRSLIKGCRLQAIVEPAPDPESRVTLSYQRDQLGMNRVQVKWHLDALVKRTFDRSFALVAEELARAGVADVTLDPPIGKGDWPSSFEQEGTWHHIGTTRMHDSPRQGVVDRNCRVHGLSNLYVAGSSVFPTAGANFPTITLVALALRLSEHLVDALRRPISVLEAQAV